MALEPKVHNLVIDKTLSIVTPKTPAMDDSSSPFVSGASTIVDRFVPNHDNDGMLNVYYILRKKKTRQAAEEQRNVVLEYQSKGC